MEEKCLKVPAGAESEACVRSVKKAMKETDFPHLKETFVKYLDF